MRFNYDINKEELQNCVIVEDFSLQADSTITIHRYYKEADGDINSSDIEGVASWIPLEGNGCGISIGDLAAQSYLFRTVENACDGIVTKEFSFFYDLQFVPSQKLIIKNLSCDRATINDFTMIVE